MLDCITLTPSQLQSLLADSQLDPGSSRELAGAGRRADPALRAAILATARFQPGLPLLLRSAAVSRAAAALQETAADATAAAAFGVDEDDPALLPSLVG